jgi:hypothetical protein
MIKQRINFLLRVLTIVVVGSASAPQETLSQEQLSELPWFKISGSHRTRYEHLWNQFQPAAPGDDAALSLRTILLAEFGPDALTAGIEVADSRVYLADDNTPLNTCHVNPFDVLQAYVTALVPNLLADGSRLRMKLGRQTMDVGSRRFVARNRFRNTINSRTGIDLEWTVPSQKTVRAFLTVPVERRVESIGDNKPQLDIERFETVLWGVVLGSRTWRHGIRAELEVFGVHEWDSEEYQTSNRNFVTPGFRILRTPALGLIDFEIESVVQVGTSRQTSLVDDLTDLSHRAFFAHLALGYTLPGVVHPRLVVQYDHATGDEDPTDDSNGRFDTLYGARRFEYGPTGIYGAFARSNVTSPGLRVEMAPRPEVEGFIAYRSVWLAQARDAWTTTGVVDLDGLSGRHLGHQIEGRFRWQILPANMRFETGFAHLWSGNFPKNVPNGAPNPNNPTFIYTQLSVLF